MKQYLFKGIDGEYRVVDHDCQGRAIEIPEGANFLTKEDDVIIFWKSKESSVCFNSNHDDWFDGAVCLDYFLKEREFACIVWQRPTPTLEYLNPFDWSLHVINPENDAVPKDWVLVPEGAERLYVSKRGHYDCDFFLKKSDKFEYRYLNSKEWKEWVDLEDPDKLEQFALKWQRHTQPEPLPFIDDDSVEQTLNKRQQQYGNFEDVAETTEDLFQVLKGGASFVNLSKSQRMALYMICSKMARLVNGDVNHKDSWHDISGYSQLIDNKL